MPCKLAQESRASQQYLIAHWRLLWRQAGGDFAALPAIMQHPDDAAPSYSRESVKPTAKGPGAQSLKAVAPVRAGWTPPDASLYAAPEVKRRPRVLFVSHDFSLTGAPRILANLLHRLRGMDVAIHSLASGPLEAAFQRYGVQVKVLPTYDAFDLVVCNTLLTASAVEGARQAGVPCVWLVHEFTPTGCGNWEAVKDAMEYPECVVFAQAGQAAQFYGVPFQRSQIIRSVIPPVPYRERMAARNTLRMGRNSFVVLTMGRDEPRKGQIDIIQASQGCNWQVQAIRNSGDPWTWYAAADVYVCSSREEVYPLAIQEAKAYGLPVVTTDLPGCVEMIQDGVNGLLYQPGDWKGLRDHLAALQGNDALRLWLGQNAARTPSFESSLLAYERLFLSAAGGATDLPLTVVYHIAGMGDHWKEIVGEQLGQLAGCGLRSVLCTHVGEGAIWCLEEARRRGIEMVMAEHNSRVEAFETPALFLIERLVRNSDKPILYLHSKGVSHTKAATIFHEWRRLMMAELVEKWRQHIGAIGTYDAIGVNWWTTADKQHFSGNFWLASAAWLRGLPDFAGYFRDRFSCERWIGSVPGCRAKSLACKDAMLWDRDRALLAQLRGVASVADG